MKQCYAFLLSCSAAVGLCFSCHPAAETGSNRVLRVGATPVPHEEILQQVRGVLASAGINLKIVVFNDYTQPNLRLVEGDLDANFYQTAAYLENFVSARGGALVSAGSVHVEPFALYSQRFRSLEALPPRAMVALPNETSNNMRGLRLLAEHRLITLRAGTGLFGSTADVVDNPKGLKFTELDAAMLARAVDSVDLCGINANYAMSAGLKPQDALAVEGVAPQYANVVAVRQKDAQAPEITALVHALQSDEVREFMRNRYGDAVLPAF